MTYTMFAVDERREIEVDQKRQRNRHSKKITLSDEINFEW